MLIKYRVTYRTADASVQELVCGGSDGVEECVKKVLAEGGTILSVVQIERDGKPAAIIYPK